VVCLCLARCQLSQRDPTGQRGAALQKIPAASFIRTHQFLLKLFFINDTTTESRLRGWGVYAALPNPASAHEQGLDLRYACVAAWSFAPRLDQTLATRGWLLGLVRQGTDGPCRHGAMAPRGVGIHP